MRLIERYQELIDRDPQDISILWKLLQMLFYLICAISGYVTAYTFHTFQVVLFLETACMLKKDLLNHRCILWAVPGLGKFGGMDFFLRRMVNESVRIIERPWQERLELTFMSELHCSSILAISILSCACGIIGFSFFSICGRGGYHVRVYYKSSRLVVPGLVLNFCMSLLSLETACDFDHGFESFQYSLNTLLNQSGIEPVMEYLQSRTKDSQNRQIWKYFEITKVSAWVGAAAWIVGFIFLILRVVNVTDFRLLKVSIYAPPKVRTHELQRVSPHDKAAET